MCYKLEGGEKEVMKCHKCKKRTSVINSRLQADGTVKRTRECKKCNFRFITLEYAKPYDNKLRLQFDAMIRKLQRMRKECTGSTKRE